MAIRDWPANERPREKLLARGPQTLSDAELLAIMLRTGSLGKSAVDLARELLSRFGGIGPLLAADAKHFCAAKGLGPAKYVQFQAAIELARRHLAEKLHREHVFTSPGVVAHFLQTQLQHHQREIFLVLFLDSHHRLICHEELFFGTVNAASVYPREVVKRALHHNAAAVIFAHNHPSGIAEPSSDDRQITHKLRDALNLVEIRTLDHLVVGAGEVISMSERGLI